MSVRNRVELLLQSSAFTELSVTSLEVSVRLVAVVREGGVEGSLGLLRAATLENADSIDS